MPHSAYIREVENSETAYLFIHGIIGSPDHFKNLIELVPKNCSVYNLLLDGHGKKVEDFAKTSMKKWEKQVEETMKHLNEKYQNIIIVGHSMGTLLSINTALKYPKKVKQLFLLSIPLKVAVKPSALSDALKVIFDKIGIDDVTADAAKKGHSIETDQHIIKYVTWIPRYIELFHKIYETDKILGTLAIPTIAFQSLQDELVSPKTYEMLKEYDTIETILLENSGHYYYTDDDYKIILEKFEEIII